MKKNYNFELTDAKYQEIDAKIRKYILEKIDTQKMILATNDVPNDYSQIPMETEFRWKLNDIFEDFLNAPTGQTVSTFTPHCGLFSPTNDYELSVIIENAIYIVLRNDVFKTDDLDIRSFSFDMANKYFEESDIDTTIDTLKMVLQKLDTSLTDATIELYGNINRTTHQHSTI